MNSHTHGTTSARAGAWLGRVWSGCIRQEVRISRWMIERGISRTVAVTVLWIVKLTAFAVLLYVTFWIAVGLAVVLIWSAINRRPDEGKQPQWLERDPDDHREDLFYHPISYNDDPDPRFDDPRHNNK